MIEESKSRRIDLLLPFLGLVAVHVLSGLQMEQPIILADELGYLGNARYLSGTAHLPDMRGCQFYHFGYSLLLLPAFWLFAEPVAIYKAVIAINALLAGALFFPLYSILTSSIKVSAGSARWIAFTCCLYPPLVLYSSFALSETAFILFYAVAAALFGKYLASRSSRDALLFGFVAGFLYTIHPRALPVIVIVLVFLLVLALLRTVPMSPSLLSASALGSVFVLTRIVNGHLKALGWAYSGEFSATKLAGRVLPGSQLPLLIERALGQALYLAQASHGLFLIGVIAVVWLLARNMVSRSPLRAVADPRIMVPIFVAFTAAGIFMASCATKLFSVHGRDGLRGADFIHGRYNEAFAVLFIAFALAEFCRKKLQIRQVVWWVIGVTAMILPATAVVMIEIDDARLRHVADKPGREPQETILPSDVDVASVPGVYPLIDLVGELDLYAISIAVIVSFLMITMAMRVSKRGGMALLVLLFSAFSLYNHRHYLSRAMAAAEPRLAFVSQAARLGPIEAISYDFARRDPAFRYGIQYLMQDTVFNGFDSSKGGKPASDVVLSGNHWRQARRLGARFVVSSELGDNALWVLPGEMQSRVPIDSYEGVVLGIEPRFGIHESGFHKRGRFEGAPVRWTNGDATLRVPLDPKELPQRLKIETASLDGIRIRLQVLANGVELWNRRVPKKWWKTFRLEPVPLGDELFIELKSNTFSPAERIEGSKDRRRLGVMVRGIRLKTTEGGGER